MKRFVVALSTLATLLTACAAGTPEAEQPKPVTSTQPPAPSVAHLGDTLDLMRIGQQRIAVTLTGVVNPATVPNGWGAAGKTYVATQLKIANTGTTTIVGNSNSDVSVLGSDNRDYRADFATVTECKDFAYGWFVLAVGSTTHGCVVFALPAGVSPTKVKYSPSSGISRDIGEWRLNA